MKMFLFCFDFFPPSFFKRVLFDLATVSFLTQSPVPYLDSLDENFVVMFC